MMPRPIYEDAHVQLYEGDARTLLPAFTDLPIDHVITDPPYFTDVYVRAGKGRKKTENIADTGLSKIARGEIGDPGQLVLPVSYWFARLVQRWALVFSDVEHCHVWRSHLVGAGLSYARTGIWYKPDGTPQMSGDRPAVAFEPITITHRAGIRFRWNAKGKRGIWTHGVVRGAARPKATPTPKPVPLIAELLEDFTDPGDLVLDPFAGGGSLGLAAQQTGRRAILFEVSPKAAQEAAQRLSEAAPRPRRARTLPV